MRISSLQNPLMQKIRAYAQREHDDIITVAEMKVVSTVIMNYNSPCSNTRNGDVVGFNIKTHSKEVQWLS